MVSPDPPSGESDGGAGQDDERVAEERLLGEHRDDLGDDARRPAGSGCTPRDARRSRRGVATATGQPPFGDGEELRA